MSSGDHDRVVFRLWEWLRDLSSVAWINGGDGVGGLDKEVVSGSGCGGWVGTFHG